MFSGNDFILYELFILTSFYFKFLTCNILIFPLKFNILPYSHFFLPQNPVTDNPHKLPVVTPLLGICTFITNNF